LFETLNSQPGTPNLCFACDGNGNVSALIDLTTGTKSATDDYNAFGETVANSSLGAYLSAIPARPLLSSSWW
jgi:hypothetical protein